MSIVNLMKSPILVDEDEWLFNNIGRLSAVIETPANKIVKVLAYSDDIRDEKEIKDIARKNKGFIIRNIDEKGIYYIT